MLTLLYSLLRKKETEQYHLFEVKTLTEDDKPLHHKYSICQRMDKKNVDIAAFKAKNEDFARKKSANIGRTVCGTCISHLYSSYK